MPLPQNRKSQLFLLGLFLFFLTVEAPGQATVKEEMVPMTTYPFSDANPLPVLGINNTVSRFYPYNMFDGYTDKNISKEWRVISLENPYIIVTVLPEVGGKVMGAIEKSTGREFVYTNHVMKFRAIGIRGPWTSGGIEHNFGLDLGHAPWAAAPVDYEIQKHADGSISCIVGGLDLASRTQWRVNIHLPKDKAYFETRALWYNPTPFREAYLSWENAAYKASDDLRFYFPGTHYIGHDGLASAWPIDKEGRNLSLYNANNFGGHKSYHVMGNARNWFGGYWKDQDFGFGHWAPYADAPGKKIWIWSLARNGAIWEDLLTDNDGQYIEAQSGVKFNQAGEKSGFHSPFTQLSLRPYYSDTKTDYWFPVKSTKGIVDASPSGTLNVISTASSLNISISPNTTINDTLEVLIDNQKVFSELVRLTPMQLYERSISLRNVAAGNVKVRLGNDKLVYASNDKENNLDRPVVSTTEKENRSAERFFRLGEQENAMRNYSSALHYYQECLKAEPADSRALTRLAEFSYRKGYYDEGLKYARQVLELDTYDAGANFIYGVIKRELDDLKNAKEAFSVAARTMEYRSAAYLQMAAINMEERDFENALEFANRALEYNRYNLSAYNLLLTGYRKSDLKPEARKISDQLLEIDPLNHYARFERYLLDPTPENLSAFKSRVRNELPHETYLELAIEYANHNLNTEAVAVLEQAPPYPTVYYWLAYLLKEGAPDRSTEYLRLALKMSPELVFPFRPETIPILSWAQSQQPSWKSLYYLALINWKRSDIEKAKELFQECADAPDYAPFYLTRSILFQNDEGQETLVERDLKTALRLAPGEWRSWHYINNRHLAKDEFAQQLSNAGKAYELFRNNAVIGMDYAKALLHTGNFQKSIDVLRQIKILPQEGAREGQDIFELANLAAAIEMMENKKYKRALRYIDASREWPENLGSGKPYSPDNRLQDFMAAICEEELSNDPRARTYYSQIERFSLDKENWNNTQQPLNNYIGFLALRKQQNHAVKELVEDWKSINDSLFYWDLSPGSSSDEFQWVLAKINSDEKKSSAFEKQLASKNHLSQFTMFLKASALFERRSIIKN
jgi:tetratricopeptide (TPR) repeat protein